MLTLVIPSAILFVYILGRDTKLDTTRITPLIARPFVRR